MGPLVVSALRTPREASTVTSEVAIIDPQDMQKRGIYELRDALNDAPGVISTSTVGGTGAAGSVFIRGTTTAYTQVVIDGVRLGDSAAQLGNILGASRSYDVGRIEVLRGPQGAIYGGESIGGVLWMETPRGTGENKFSSTFEGGSFQTFLSHASEQGEEGGLSYFLSGGLERSDGDHTMQGYRHYNTALRLEAKTNDTWTLGTTLRMADSYYENGGESDDYFDSALATVYAHGVISDVWTTRVLASCYQESYDSDSAFGNYGTDLRDMAIANDHEITLADGLRLLAGGFVHHTTYRNTIGTDESRDRYGLHGVLEWDATDALTCTAALRWEDYDDFGDELTWRIGLSQELANLGTTLRAGIGSSFRAPTYLDLYGSSFGPGNPALNAESALGWDIGITQKLGPHHQLELAYFRNLIDDRINSSFAPPVNIPGTTASDGIELGMSGKFLHESLSYRLAWTWLHRSMSDQPRNAATASLDWQATDKLSLGIGATHLASRSWGSLPLSSYTVARIHGSYQLNEQVRLHARIENALDADYELFGLRGWSYGGYTQPDSFVPAPGLGIFAGVTVDF